MHPLTGPKIKVERARKEIKSLYYETHWFFNREVGGARLVKRQRRTGTYPLQLPDGIELPAEWGILIGEVAYNLRSALDQLLCQLIIKSNPGSDWRLCRQQRRYFPICLWGPRTRRKLPRGETRFSSNDWGCLRPSYVTLIQSAQPYHRRNGLRRSPLWLLKELNDAEKHNLIIFAGGYDAGISIRPQPLTSGVIDAFFGMDTEPNATIADAEKAKENVNVYVEHFYEIRFGRGCDAVQNLPVVRTLMPMANEVSRIIESFASEFPSQEPSTAKR